MRAPRCHKGALAGGQGHKRRWGCENPARSALEARVLRFSVNVRAPGSWCGTPSEGDSQGWLGWGGQGALVQWQQGHQSPREAWGTRRDTGQGGMGLEARVRAHPR